MPIEPLPRITDNRPARRPGGARGSPFPDLAVDAAVVVWLANGDSLRLDAAASAADGFAVPWGLVAWWIPV
jgi:hypothetical protein